MSKTTGGESYGRKRQAPKAAPRSSRDSAQKPAGQKAPSSKSAGSSSGGTKRGTPLRSSSGSTAVRSGAPKGSSPSRPGRRAATPRVSLAQRARRLLYACLIGGVAAIGGLFVLLNSVEIPDPIRELKITSLVCGANVADGQCTQQNDLAQFSSSENRFLIPIDLVSQHMIDAVIAAEDRTYFEHTGIDPFGILRALVRDVQGQGSQQGGSTLTQQYVKQVYLTQERTINRKLREAAISIKLERKYSKIEILERYLNEIYFGRGAYGVESAADVYFGKDASDLTISESAYLAGLIRSPNLADIVENPKEAYRRRKTVLDAMVIVGSITPQERAEAEAVKLEEAVRPPRPPNTGTRVSEEFQAVGGEYAMEWVREQLKDMDGIGESAVYSGGLRIYLTIDPTLQAQAHESVVTTYDKPEDPSTALVSVDSEGRIVALIGGKDGGASKVNLALGKEGGGSGRPAGSTFKAIALAAYVQEGYSVKSKIYAGPIITFPGADDGEDWEVKNFDDEDWGETTVDFATWHSSNTAYAQIMEKLTPAKVVTMAAKVGIKTPVKPVLSSVLGTTDVSPLELATAYSTFANHGVLKPPFIIRRVENALGEVLYDVKSDALYAPRKVIEPAVADTVSSVLTGVLKEGTGTGAQIKQAAAGKTGTTQNFRDAWFAGYTCHFTTVIWNGFPGEPNQPVPTMENIRGLKGITGGSFPATMWKKFMGAATEGTSKCEIPPLDSGTTVDVADTRFLPTTTTTVPVETTVAPATPTPANPVVATPTPTPAAPAAAPPPAAEQNTG